MKSDQLWETTIHSHLRGCKEKLTKKISIPQLSRDLKRGWTIKKKNKKKIERGVNITKY